MSGVLTCLLVTVVNSAYTHNIDCLGTSLFTIRSSGKTNTFGAIFYEARDG